MIYYIILETYAKTHYIINDRNCMSGFKMHSMESALIAQIFYWKHERIVRMINNYYCNGRRDIALWNFIASLNTVESYLNIFMQCNSYKYYIDMNC